MLLLDQRNKDLERKSSVTFGVYSKTQSRELNTKYCKNYFEFPLRIVLSVAGWERRFIKLHLIKNCLGSKISTLNLKKKSDYTVYKKANE